MQAIANGVEDAYSLRDEANELLDTVTKILYEKLGLPEFDEQLVEYLPTPVTASGSQGRFGPAGPLFQGFPFVVVVAWVWIRKSRVA